MKAAPYNKTPLMEEEEDLLIKKEYITKYNSDLIKIMIGKTKNNIIIRNTYYELKLNKDDLSLLTRIMYKSIDESFEYIENIFNKNKYKIKEKSSKKIKLSIIIYDIIKEKEKDIELILLENFDNQNIYIKDLFNKYINIEKEMNEIKNDNKIIKEENNKLKKDNNNLKNEIEFIKNNNNNNIGSLQMKYMNMFNTMNMIQQQINQFIYRINEIEQKINMMSNNSLNLMNQNNLNSMNNIYNSNNNFNQMNQYFMNNNNNLNIMNKMCDNLMNYSLNNISDDYNNEISVIFRPSGFEYNPVEIQCRDDDKISTLIEKFIIKTNFDVDEVKFMFLAKELNGNLTVQEAGIYNHSNIFVVSIKYVVFKISGMKGVNFPFKIFVGFNKYKVSEIIDSFISESGLDRSQILKYVFNSKILDEDSTIKSVGLKNKSEVIAYIKNPIDFIYIYFQSINNDSMNNDKYIKIECLKTETIKTLLYRYRYKTNNIYSFIIFSFNSQEIYNYGEKIEEAGLKNKSIIIANFKYY